MDIQLEDTIDYKFTSRAFATGIPTVLTAATVVIYEDNGTTEITAAETLTVDFDTIVGLNNLRIVCTAANGFEAGKSYSAVLSAGTVGGVSVIGETICNFSIERSPVNWAKVAAPTTALNLSGTDTQLVGSVTGAVGSVTGAVGSVTGSVGSVTGAVGSVTGATGSVTGAVGSVAGNVGGNVTGSVGSLVGHTVQTTDHTAGIAAIPTTAMRGTDSAGTAANLATVDTVVDAIKVATDKLVFTVANQVDVNVLSWISTAAATPTTAGVPEVDLTYINGVAASAANLEKSAGTIVTGTVDTTAFTATTTILESDDITTAAADHYNGRIILFTSGTLQNQATDITDYELNGGRGKFTYTAVTSAPADDVTFVIV